MTHMQQCNAWATIHAQPHQHITARDKFTELILAAKNRTIANTHRPLNLVTRRASKQANQHRGELIIKSWPKIRFGVPIERVFVNERYTHRLSKLPRI